MLEPLENDVIKVDIDKRTNEITLVKKFGQSTSNTKRNIDLNTSVNNYIDFWLWNHRRKGEKDNWVKDTTFQDYVGKAQLIKNKMGSVILEDGTIEEVKVSELTFEFIEEKLLEIFNETCNTTAVQVRNHMYNMMRYAKKDGAIQENPLADEKINFPATAEKFKRKIIEESDIQAVIEYCLRHWYIDVLTQLFTRWQSS